MRHVLLLASWYPADAADVKGVFFRDQALALEAFGHEVGVVAVNLRSLRTVMESPRVGPAFEVDTGVPTYREEVWAALPRVPYGNYCLWRRAAKRLFERYVRERGRPDVIHAHAAIYAGAVAAELGRAHRIPVVLTEHSSGFARRAYRRWQWRLAASAAEGAARRIVVSPGLGELLGRELATGHKDWIWVPNVVAERFIKASRREHSRSTTRFLSLALMTPNKGQQDLLSAYALAFRGQPDFELWLGGDGPSRYQLEAQVRNLGLEEQVRFLGRVQPDAVPALLTEVDVMVVASHYETFGVVAAEALMSGRPVVATRCGGPECIVSEGDGLLVEPGAPQQLARALRAISERLSDYPPDVLSERARARFGGAAVAEQLTVVYSEAIDEVVTRQASG